MTKNIVLLLLVLLVPFTVACDEKEKAEYEKWKLQNPAPGIRGAKEGIVESAENVRGAAQRQVANVATIAAQNPAPKIASANAAIGRDAEQIINEANTIIGKLQADLATLEAETLDLHTKAKALRDVNEELSDQNAVLTKKLERETAKSASAGMKYITALGGIGFVTMLVFGGAAVIAFIYQMRMIATLCSVIAAIGVGTMAMAFATAKYYDTLATVGLVVLISVLVFATIGAGVLIYTMWANTRGLVETVTTTEAVKKVLKSFRSQVETMLAPERLAAAGKADSVRADAVKAFDAMYDSIFASPADGKVPGVAWQLQSDKTIDIVSWVRNLFSK